MTLYMWTATGMRPSELANGAMRYVRETDHDALLAALRDLTAWANDRRQLAEFVPEIATAMNAIDAVEKG